MQSLLLLKSSDEGPVDRLINIGLLSMASPHPENPEHTRCCCGVFDITIQMPFVKFLEQVQYLIAENYRVGTENSIQWHKKRMTDTENMMKSVMQDHHKS